MDVSIFERIRKSISMVLAGVNDREQTTLWCGGIPREFVAGDLDKAAAKMRQLFEPFGRVATVTVRQKAAARGSWALVTFTNSAAIEKAMRAGVSVPSDGQVIPTPSRLLDRISPIFPRSFPSFARFHRLAETVPTSHKPEPKAKRQ